MSEEQDMNRDGASSSRPPVGFFPERIFDVVIVVRQLAATEKVGARVKARTEGKSVTLSWDYSLDYHNNCRKAARVLAEKCGRSGEWAAGYMPGTAEVVFTQYSTRAAGFVNPAFYARSSGEIADGMPVHHGT